ncbi:MAG: carotenoid 1,2-hydratase [Planctomycetes bacterium]|nr:carotenoid 1,2-hydratase [Planctomycetota bacterium]
MECCVAARWFACALLLVGVGACARREARPAAGLGVAEALGGAGDVTGFARATAPPQLQFPRDHGPHPEFRTEWWYFTGNVATAAGRRFGVQLVFFRQALAAAVPARDAALAARDMILAHAAVTDVDGRRFHFAERLARSAADLGGVRGGDGRPFAAECADWSARAVAGSDDLLPLELRAADGAFAFGLRVDPGKPVVLQGDRGLSQKSAAVGNASIYYSMTRLPMAGTIEVDGQTHQVRGEAWLDREWSTSALGAEQVGWDWFSLQLDNGEELMWYRLRRRDGAVDPWSRGTLVAADGRATRLEPAQVVAEPSGTWTARDGGAVYPARWRLRGVDPDLDLQVEPLLADQELDVLVRYWEGAVTVRGTRAGTPVTGRGYLEMTGYVLPR